MPSNANAMEHTVSQSLMGFSTTFIGEKLKSHGTYVPHDFAGRTEEWTERTFPMEINFGGWAEIKSGQTFTAAGTPMGPLISFCHKVGWSENECSIIRFGEIPNESSSPGTHQRAFNLGHLLEMRAAAGFCKHPWGLTDGHTSKKTIRLLSCITSQTFFGPFLVLFWSFCCPFLVLFWTYFGPSLGLFWYLGSRVKCNFRKVRSAT